MNREVLLSRNRDRHSESVIGKCCDVIDLCAFKAYVVHASRDTDAVSRNYQTSQLYLQILRSVSLNMLSEVSNCLFSMCTRCTSLLYKWI